MSADITQLAKSGVSQSHAAYSAFTKGLASRCIYVLRTVPTSSLSTCYKKHEKIKKRAYKQCIREVEHALFTPVGMSATGGLSP